MCVHMYTWRALQLMDLWSNVKEKLRESLRILIYLFALQHIKRKLKDSLSFIRYGAAVLEISELLEELEGSLKKNSETL